MVQDEHHQEYERDEHHLEHEPRPPAAWTLWYAHECEHELEYCAHGAVQGYLAPGFCVAVGVTCKGMCTRLGLAIVL
jgi:hypothetical protein